MTMTTNVPSLRRPRHLRVEHSMYRCQLIIYPLCYFSVIGPQRDSHHGYHPAATDTQLTSFASFDLVQQPFASDITNASRPFFLVVQILCDMDYD
jgi:hypothetical protein